MLLRVDAAAHGCLHAMNSRAPESGNKSGRSGSGWREHARLFQYTKTEQLVDCSSPFDFLVPSVDLNDGESICVSHSLFSCRSHTYSSRCSICWPESFPSPSDSFEKRRWTTRATVCVSLECHPLLCVVFFYTHISTV